MALLQIKDISLSFGGLKAVDQVSLAVNQGEIVSLIGPNGAGKTTIFNILTGIYRIEGGELLFEGAPIHNKSPQDIVKAGIARTFQNIRLFRRMRVIENVLIGSNGAGKTTTLGCITGLVAARSGAIVYRGLPITNYPAHKVVGLGVSLAPEGREVLQEAEQAGGSAL